MLFRYDFGEKLDLTKFAKQAEHYMGQMQQIDYHIVLPNYKVKIDVVTVSGATEHHVNIRIFNLTRDKDGEISFERRIFPSIDSTFKEFKIIKEIWFDNLDSGHWSSHSTAASVEKIINIIKIVHKISGLQAFI